MRMQHRADGRGFLCDSLMWWDRLLKFHMQGCSRAADRVRTSLAVLLLVATRSTRRGGQQPPHPPPGPIFIETKPKVHIVVCNRLLARAPHYLLQIYHILSQVTASIQQLGRKSVGVVDEELSAICIGLQASQAICSNSPLLKFSSCKFLSISREFWFLSNGRHLLSTEVARSQTISKHMSFRFFFIRTIRKQQ
jgi:hypothetical protein